MGAPVNDELVDWLESEDVNPDTESIDIGEYDLTSTPNDFNVKTIVDFLKSGVFEVPSFQRNFVWDLRRRIQADRIPDSRAPCAAALSLREQAEPIPSR